jgi:hypothetical protein
MWGDGGGFETGLPSRGARREVCGLRGHSPQPHGHIHTRNDRRTQGGINAHRRPISTSGARREPTPEAGISFEHTYPSPTPQFCIHLRGPMQPIQEAYSPLTPHTKTRNMEIAGSSFAAKCPTT